MDTIIQNKAIQSVLKDESTQTELTAPARDEHGRFLPGVSGNPKGKPIGAKAKATLMRQAMELAIIEGLENDILDVVKQAITLAKAGDTSMIKLLLDKTISNKNEYHNEDKNKDRSSGGIVINITAMDKIQPKEIKGELIEDEG